MELELEAKELLRSLLPKSSRTAIVRAYRELRDARGTRPSAGELFRMGHDSRTVRAKYGSWFEFVWDEGDLALDATTFAAVKGWLREVEVTSMTKCFKAVTRKVMLEHGDLSAGMELDEIARRSYELIIRSPELFDDIRGVRALGDARSVSAEDWASYWRGNPIAAWENSEFAEVLDGRLRFAIGELASDANDAIYEATRELVDFRLAQYRARKRGTFYANVIRNPSGKPILMFGNRGGRESIPEGEVEVEIDGDLWAVRFVKIAVNVASPAG